MRFAFPLRLAGLLLVLVALSATRLAAQVGVPIEVRITDIAEDEGSAVTIAGTFLATLPNVGNQYYSGYTNGGAPNDTIVAGISVRALPGVSYLLDASGSPSATIEVTAPQGYRVILNQMQRTRVANDGPITFQLEALGVRHPALAGLVYSLDHTSVDWRLSLGSLMSGANAGDLSVVDPGAASDWSALFTPAMLNCEPRSSEVKVYRVSGVIRQLAANQMGVDVVTLTSTSYELRCYDRPQVTGSGPFTFSGDPFVTYKIEQGATSTTLKLTKSVRNVTNTYGSFSVARTEVMTFARSGTWPNHTWTNSDWTLLGQTPLSEVSVVGSGTWSARTETIAARVPGASTAALNLVRTYTADSYLGESLASETVGTGSQSRTASFTYYPYASPGYGYEGMFKSAALPGGGTQAVEYYPTPDKRGQIKYRRRPFADQAYSEGVAGEVTYYEYAQDCWNAFTLPSLIRTTTNNTVTAQKVFSYDHNQSSGPPFYHPVTLITETDLSDNTAGIVTTTIKYREDVSDPLLRGQPKQITTPDGMIHTFAYESGNWDGTTFTSMGNGYSEGRAARITVSPSLGDSTKIQMTIRDQRGLLVREEWREAGNSNTIVAYTNYTYDSAGHLTSRTKSVGGTYTATYSGGLKTSETDEAGVVTNFTYDVAGRVATATRTGSGAIGAVVTTYTYDALGQVTQESVGASGTSEQFVTTRVFDDAGRVTSETVPGLGATTHAYNVSARTHTTTRPDGSTLIETACLDGRLASKTGTAVVPEYHSYGVEPGTDGRLWHRTDLGTASSARWRTSWTDWLGRPVRDERPGFTGQPNLVETHAYAVSYGNGGQLWKTTKPGSAPIIYHYASGYRYATSLDLDNNATSTSNPSSADRVTYNGRGVVSESPNFTYTVLQISYPSGAVTQELALGNGAPANRLAQSKSIDTEGNVTLTIADLTPSTRTVTKTTTKTGIATAAVEISVNGLVTSVTDTAGLTTTTKYDALLRPSIVTDSRGNKTKTTYYSGTKLVYQILDRYNETTSTGTVVATYHYDSLGRKDWADDAAGSAHRIYFGYNKRGQLLRQWGPGTYPVAYAYSAYGEQIALRTFRNPTQNFTTASWPLSDDGSDASNPDPASWTVGDITRWLYDGPSGLLAEKQFQKIQPTDPLRTIKYTYNAAGQLSTREWARTVPSGANAGQRVKATYTYDPGTGEQTGIAYNDGTPGIAKTYTKGGDLDSVTDATGTRDLVYTPTGARPWRLDAEAMDTFYGQRVLTPLYSSSGTLGMVRGFKLGATVGSNSELEQTYDYAAASGRFDTLTAKHDSNAGTRAFHYAYLANSALLESLSVDSSHPFTISRTFETGRDVLTSVETKWSTASRSRSGYQVNDLGQRTVLEQSGDVFTGYGGTNNLINETFAYNARGELTSAPTALGAAGGSGSALANRQHEFDYDAIGNRKWAGVTGNSADRQTYTANALNQYASRQTVLTLFSGTQTFAHDADGNVTDDGQWLYTWDAENRLVAMETKSTLIGAGIAAADARRLEFKYDYLGRRVQKLVLGWSGTAYTTFVSARRFLYSGWSLLAEYSLNSSLSTLTLQRTYTWGLDIARSLTDAGGVGALLQIHDHAANKDYLPSYDGNGNVTALFDADSVSGTCVATYEYSPFGELLRCSGTYASENPFRFSTKFTDDETGFVYYGYRYYSPSQGRFLGRDPKEEAGGLNLYGFCGNNAICRWDLLGNGWYWTGAFLSTGSKDGSNTEGDMEMVWHPDLQTSPDLTDYRSDDPGMDPRTLRGKLKSLELNAGPVGGGSVGKAIDDPAQRKVMLDILTKSVTFVKDRDYAQGWSEANQTRALNAIVDVVLSGTDYGKSVLTQIQKDGVQIGFKAGDSTAGIFESNVDGRHFLQLDPSGDAFVGNKMYDVYEIPKSEVATGRYADAITIGHELGHALFDYDDPWIATGRNEVGKISGWAQTNVTPSQNIVTYENQLRAALGLDPRITYHGNPTFPKPGG